MSLKIKLLKLLDRSVGPLLVNVANMVPARGGACANKMLVMRPGGMGDAVLLLPVIHELKRQQPDLTITMLAEQRNAEIFRHGCGIDRVLCYDRPRELLQLFRNRYDIIVDTEQSHRLSAVIARTLGAPVRIGFASNDRRGLFSQGISYDGEAFERLNFERLFVPLGYNASADGVARAFEIPTDAAKRTDALLDGCVPSGFVAVFPGASVPEKEWGTDNFAVLGERLYAQGLPIVVVGGRTEVSASSTIAARCHGLNLAGRTSLAETAAVLGRASVVVSGDSGLLHLAALLQVPTVALFGPSDPRKWAPRGPHHRLVYKGQSCSPCSVFANIPQCKFALKCMAQISVEEVFSAVLDLLREPRK
jgi:lipopolysaccharide heptosyltransferase II